MVRASRVSCGFSLQPFRTDKAGFMNTMNIYHNIMGGLRWLALAALLAQSSVARAADEEKMSVLQAGTHTYTNVTITTKAKNYILIVHSTGMATIKAADLPADLRDKLGYTAAEEAAQGKVGAATRWAKHQMAAFSAADLQAVAQLLEQDWRIQS